MAEVGAAAGAGAGAASQPVTSTTKTSLGGHNSAPPSASVGLASTPSSRWGGPELGRALSHVLAYVGPAEWTAAAVACKAWHARATDDVLWRAQLMGPASRAPRDLVRTVLPWASTAPPSRVRKVADAASTSPGGSRAAVPTTGTPSAIPELVGCRDQTCGGACVIASLPPRMRSLIEAFERASLAASRDTLLADSTVPPPPPGLMKAALCAEEPWSAFAAVGGLYVAAAATGRGMDAATAHVAIAGTDNVTGPVPRPVPRAPPETAAASTTAPSRPALAVTPDSDDVVMGGEQGEATKPAIRLAPELDARDDGAAAGMAGGDVSDADMSAADGGATGATGAPRTAARTHIIAARAHRLFRRAHQVWDAIKQGPDGAGMSWALRPGACPRALAVAEVRTFGRPLPPAMRAALLAHDGVHSSTAAPKGYAVSALMKVTDISDVVMLTAPAGTSAPGGGPATAAGAAAGASPEREATLGVAERSIGCRVRLLTLAGIEAAAAALRGSDSDRHHCLLVNAWASRAPWLFARTAAIDTAYGGGFAAEASSAPAEGGGASGTRYAGTTVPLELVPIAHHEGYHQLFAHLPSGSIWNMSSLGATPMARDYIEFVQAIRWGSEAAEAASGGLMFLKPRPRASS